MSENIHIELPQTAMQSTISKCKMKAKQVLLIGNDKGNPTIINFRAKMNKYNLKGADLFPNDTERITALNAILE